MPPMEVRAVLYTLWDMETSNLVGEFDERARALAVVREGLRRHGPDDAATLALDVEDEDGWVETIASGTGLAELALSEPHAERIAG